MSIETVLKAYFGCKKTFLQNPKLISETIDGNKEYEYMTKAGNRAYNKLVGVVYALGSLGLINNVNSIVDKLDAIVDSEAE